MKAKRLTRRRAVQIGAAMTLPLVHIRTAGAAGKLNVGFWDHWVPGGTEAMRKQVTAWAGMNKVEVTADFITSQGNKLLLTAAAEGQAQAGHDFIPFLQWDTIAYADQLEPVDDVINPLIDKYGKYDPTVEYLAKSKGYWTAVPGTDPTAALTCCARIGMLKQYAGIDIQEMFPARPSDPALSAKWTYETFLKAAEACHKAGFPFGMGLGSTGDSVNNTGAIFSAHGAHLVNAKGEITINSDNVRQVMEYGQKFVKFLPSDTVSYDDASNNRALISGKSALIYNPPSAWAVAKRDSPEVAKDCWTFPCPAGSVERSVPYVYVFYGIWKFAKNKSAAKDLLHYLMEREQVEARAIASEGFNLPPQLSMGDFKVWEEVEPPRGTVYNYPIRPGTIRDLAYLDSLLPQTSQCKCSIGRSSQRCGRSCTVARRSSRQPTGPHTRSRGSFGDTFERGLILTRADPGCWNRVGVNRAHALAHAAGDAEGLLEAHSSRYLALPRRQAGSTDLTADRRSHLSGSPDKVRHQPHSLRYDKLCRHCR